MKAELELDVCIELQPEGITRLLFIGQACEPNYESLYSWEEIVERHIGYYLVPGSNTIRPGDAEDLEKTIAGLEQAIALFREKIEQHKE